MRLFWLIIGIFMIFAGLVAWARMDPARNGDSFAQVTEPPADQQRPATPAPPQPGRELDLPKSNATDDLAETADAKPDEDGLNGVDGRDSEGPSVDDEELAELDVAQRLAEELFDSATARQSTATEKPDAPVGAPREGDAPDDDGYQGVTSLDIKQGHDHQPEQLQNPENPWEQAAQKADELQPLEHSVQEKPDGTIVLDETFEITGKGTAADPYEVTWDLLLSAAETFQPRLGMNDMPERIQMLDGKYVKISGHLLFPMIGMDAREVLVMLNMWDGCCLGTMPSPYDAIEVQLAEPVRANNRNFMNFGTLEGRLSVDPYLINDWLLGLYVMEDARLNIGM